jgi:hypothetical protein
MCRPRVPHHEEQTMDKTPKRRPIRQVTGEKHLVGIWLGHTEFTELRKQSDLTSLTMSALGRALIRSALLKDQPLSPS